jgi:ketosteroid isomerase-like protein
LGVLNRDTLALMGVWSEHFIVNAPGNRVRPNRQVVFDLIRQGNIHYSAFEATIEHIRVDGDIAIVMGAETVRPTGRARLAGQTVNCRFTHVWRKGEAGWRLIARHANIIPSL